MPFAHEGVHLPSAHTSPAEHCVPSKHWSLGAVQTPFTQRYPLPALVQSESAPHAAGFSALHAGGFIVVSQMYP
jgi:hypothetical protein